MSNLLLSFLLYFSLLGVQADGTAGAVATYEVRAQAFLALLAGGDETAIGDFVEENLAPGLRDAYPLETHVGLFRQLRDELGEVSVTGRVVVGNSLEMSLTSEVGQPVRIVFEFEPSEPYLIRNLSVEDGTAENTEADSGALPLESLSELHEELQRRTAENTFSGVVLVAKPGAPVFLEAYGEADKRYGLPNTPDTRFNIGSINKDITAVAVLQLTEKGLLKLDDPIGMYLQGFPEAVAKGVTLEQLLQHRSGWGDYFGHPAFEAQLADFRSISDYLAFARELPLEFEPGTAQRYSNVGYEVLGAVIEAVSGMSYYDYVREHIYAPLGMNDTDAFERDLPVERLAVGYTNQSPYGPDEGYERENTFMLPPRGTAAGGGYATAEDLLRLYRALLDGELLSPPYNAYFFSRFTRLDDEMPEVGGLGLSGGAPGLNAAAEIDLATGIIVIVLSNYDPPVAEELAPRVMRLARDERR